MFKELKEKIVHGTKSYPYEQYNIRNRTMTFQIPVHWHDEMEIIAVERGCLDLKIGDDVYEGRTGDVFFVNPRELHLMGQSEIDGLYYTLLFPMEFISFQTQDSLEEELLSPIRSNKLFFPHQLPDELKEKVYPLLEGIIKANIQKHDIKSNEISLSRQHLRTRILLLEILECLYENDALIKSASSRDTTMQKEMLAYIDAHCMEKITLSMLAEEFHMSDKYISRYFVNHFKISFSNYVLHHRLTYARQLLESTDEQVTEIALMSGFANVSYFIRAFKKMFGVSPLKYRKRM